MKYLALLGIAALAVTAGAQGDSPVPAGVATWTADQLKAKGWSRLFFNTNLGSFKSIDGLGHIEFSFTGTVLIAKLQGTATPTGKVRKEYDKNGRALYSGTGTMVVDGKWRGIEWFGSDMKAVWAGKGVVRITGEFDRNLETGQWWYDGSDFKRNWGAAAMAEVHLPEANYGADTSVKPRERKSGGG